jgi:hypothetical protein
VSRRAALSTFAKAAIGATVLGAAARYTSPDADATPAPAENGTSFPLLHYQINDQRSLDNGYKTIAAIAQIFDWVDMQNWLLTADAVRTLRAGRVRTVTYYRIPFLVFGWEENWGEYNRHDAWFVHDGPGRRRKESDAFVLNPANPEVRAYQISVLKSYVDRFALDGVYLDGPAGYRMTKTWHRDVLQFFRDLRAALPIPKQIWTNSLGSYFAGDPFDWAPLVDGYEMEAFLTQSWDKLHYDLGYARACMRDTQRCISLNKGLLMYSGFSHGDPPTRRAWQLFEYAAYLMLVGSAPVYWGWGYNEPDVRDFPALHWMLGRPLTPPRQRGDVWTREFSRASVRVDLANPPDASIKMK